MPYSSRKEDSRQSRAQQSAHVVRSRSSSGGGGGAAGARAPSARPAASAASAAAANASGGNRSAGAVPDYAPRPDPNVPCPSLEAAFPTHDLGACATFCFIGDHGLYARNAALASAMALCVQRTKPFNAIIELGDLLYPEGPSAANARDFFVKWKARFASGPLAGIPHKLILGNHCVSGDGSRETLLGLTTSPLNRGGEWQMRGNNPTEAPSTFYTWAEPVFLPRLPGVAGDPVAQQPKRSAPQPAQVQPAANNAAAPQQAVPVEGAAAAAASSVASAAPAASAPAAAPAASTASQPPAQQPKQQQQQQQRQLVGLVHLTAIETNIASSSTMHRNPEINADAWFQQIAWLSGVLSAQNNNTLTDDQRAAMLAGRAAPAAAASAAAAEGERPAPPAGSVPDALKLPPTLFTVCMGHHPCYCVGRGHCHQAMVLRTKRNTIPSDQGRVQCSRPGLGLEDVLVRAGADLYVAGHEHVCAIGERRGGVVHATSGSGAEADAYGGVLQRGDAHHFDFVNASRRAFMVGCVYYDLEDRTVKMALSFLAVEQPYPCAVLFTKTITCKR